MVLILSLFSDYAIPGTPATNGAKCHFLYRSSTRKYGSFNSPRNPSNYPSNALCRYEFIGNEREQVRISFENFKTDDVSKKQKPPKATKLIWDPISKFFKNDPLFI